MTGTLAERALAAAHDVIIYLRDRGDRSEASGWKAAAGRQKSRARAETRQTANKWRRDYGAEKDTNGRLLLEELASWEADAAKAWAQAGRLAEGGRLRVPEEKAAPWTDAQVRATFPALSDADMIAALIAADGLIDEEDWAMGKYRNIRAAIEEIIELKLRKLLPEARSERAPKEVLGVEVDNASRPKLELPPAGG